MKKLKIFLIIVAIFLVFTGFDYVRSKMFSIEILEIDPQEAVADGQSPVTIIAQLTNHQGEPVEGHVLYIWSQNGGKFRSYREETDSKGMVTFTYFPYKVNKTTKLRDVALQILDEDNAIFIDIQTKCDFVLKMIEPEEEEAGNSLSNLINW